ncbi:SemiSWEET family sugar transporter [Ferruginibacter sp.]|uniref:SemiSWEET family sugar transporter n=1 Tax=Ferruginibacter sp. TaxID=1940288 RepID=UPI00265AB5B2|nr:SemiSWEET family transporter [Ferruginibacter sp.]
MNKIVITGIAASVLSGMSLVPQLIKLMREKKAVDISQPMLVILFIGLSCWIYYGILHRDAIIIISNSFSVIVNLLILFFTMKYRIKSNTYKEFFMR